MSTCPILTSEIAHMLQNKLHMVMLHLEMGDAAGAKERVHEASQLVKGLTMIGEAYVETLINMNGGTV